MKTIINIIKISVILIFIQGCNSENIDYCPDIDPIVSEGSSYWQESEQYLSYTSTHNPIAIACHNCYVNNSADVIDTELVIESAINNNADIVELDVVIPTDNYIGPMVSHDLKSVKVNLYDVLAVPALLQSSAGVFIEIKGKVDNKQYIRDILDTLMQFKNSVSEYSYFNQHRIIAFRSFELYSTLLTLHSVLMEDKYLTIAPFVKLNSLHYLKEQKALLAEIQQSYQCGMNMVELDYRAGASTIKTLNEYAESLGLGVGVFTLDETTFEVAIKALQDDVDVFIISTDETSKLSQTIESIFLRAREFINGNSRKNGS